MANVNEISNAIKILIKSGTNRKNISILHCNTEYPVLLDRTNLNSIKYLKKDSNWMLVSLIIQTVLRLDL